MAKKTVNKRAKSLYFPHDYTAKDDPGILELRAEFGAEGYGLYWMLVESLYKNAGHLSRDGIGGLSLSYGVAKDKIKEIIDFCIDIELFVVVNSSSIFMSERINHELEKRKILSKNGSAGAKKRWGGHSEAIPTPIAYRAEQSITEQRDIYNLFPKNFINDDFIKYLDQFLQSKSEPLSPAGQTLLVKQLFQYEVSESIEALQDAIRNGWKGVFPKSIPRIVAEESQYGYSEVFGEDKLPETKEIYDWVMARSSCPSESSSAYKERDAFQDAGFRRDNAKWLKKYYEASDGLSKLVKKI